MGSYWRIHGELYDLNPFLNEHPGGKAILLASRDLPDATPLFESYHAFAARAAIRRKLATFRVTTSTEEAPRPLYSFDEKGFYRVLTERVRREFHATSDEVSVTHAVKADGAWRVKVGLQVLAWVTVVLAGNFLVASPALSRCLMFFAGFLFISIGFNVMHDASHFALAKRNGRLNDLALRTWIALALWRPEGWLVHHVVRHHSFTGDAELDPDISHAKPLIRKSLNVPRSRYVNIVSDIRLFWILYSVLVFGLLPGMFVGQIASYHVLWRRGRLWKMPRIESSLLQEEGMSWWEMALSFAVLGCFLLRPINALVYLVACNVAYAVCILPDHDTLDSAVLNHVPSSSQEVMDWGEVQVRHSSDFGVGLWGWILSELMGGINQQIAHHLFPSVSHRHLGCVSRIVEETCREFDLPFVRHDGLISALMSFIDTLMETMVPSKKEEKERKINRPRSPRPRSDAAWSARCYDLTTGTLLGASVTLCLVNLYR